MNETAFENEYLPNNIDELQKKILHLENTCNELSAQNEYLLLELQKKDEIIATFAFDDNKEKKTRHVKFKMVTVLYADVKDYSSMKEHLEAEMFIDELDRFYFHFDFIIKKYNIEKIRSIGDSYLCAGGIPIKNRTNPVDVLLAALEMLEYHKKLQIESEKKNKQIWNLTFGIHTGPVVVDITPSKKNIYDISGDTVNIANRIEAAGCIGKISISAATYEHIKEFFLCEYNGKMPVKFKGDTAIYNVISIRPDLSIDNKGLEPNQLFKFKIQKLKYDDLEEFIIEKLEKELPSYLQYRNLKHTIDVTIAVEIIAVGENIDEEQLLLLKIAALMHDVGYIMCYDKHEEYSVKYAKELLPLFGYTFKQIEIVNGLILATKFPPEPKNHLEKIICDANLDFLSRKDFLNSIEAIFKEMKHNNLVGNIHDWYKILINFIENNDFYTSTARKMRQISREQQIQILSNLIKN